MSICCSADITISINTISIKQEHYDLQAGGGERALCIDQRGSTSTKIRVQIDNN